MFMSIKQLFLYKYSPSPIWYCANVPKLKVPSRYYHITYRLSSLGEYLKKLLWQSSFCYQGLIKLLQEGAIAKPDLGFS